MKRIMKKYCSLIVCLVMLVTCMTGFFSGMEATASDASTVTKENGVKYIWHEDISTYRTTKDENGYYTDTNIPELDGYVFGGWFKNSDDTSSIGTATSGGAWAKFVPEATFTIKAQLSILEPTSGVDFSDLLTSVQKVNLRFVTGVDSLKYKKVIFKVTHLNKTVEQEMTSVMSQIDIKAGEDSTYDSKKARDVFGTAAEYFATLRFTGIAASTANGERYQKDWTITPMLVTQDGTLVQGVTREGLKIADGAPERFQVSAMSQGGLTVDTKKGKVTANITDGNMKTLWFATDNNGNNSKSWEITGTFTELKTLTKGFIIRQADYPDRYRTFLMTEASVTVNKDADWTIGTYSAGGGYVFANADYDAMLDGTPKKFKAIIQDDIFSLWVEDKLVWQLPLTDSKFGTFTKGSAYEFGLRCWKNGGQAEWSDLKVKYEEKFLVNAKTDASITADYLNGKITANLTDAGTKTLWFSTDGTTHSTKSWELTGTYKELNALTKGFIIRQADNQDRWRYFKMSETGVTVVASWGDVKSYTTDKKTVFTNADYSTLGNGTTKKFKAVIQDDIFSFWVEDKLAWQLPLTDSGFDKGSAYELGLRCQGNGGQAQWSNLKVKYGEDVGSYKFLVEVMHDGLTADTMTGKVTANLTDSNVKTLWFATDNDAYSSTNWEITGTFKQLAPLMKGFTIQSSDGNTTGFYTMWTGGISLNNNSGYPVSGGNGWNVYAADQQYVFANAEYDTIDDGTAKKFKAVIRNDEFSFWVEDELVWQLPLTNEKFGGFAAGTSYRLALRCLDNGGQAEWSNLTVKYGE